MEVLITNVTKNGLLLNNQIANTNTNITAPYISDHSLVHVIRVSSHGKGFGKCFFFSAKR